MGHERKNSFSNDTIVLAFSGAANYGTLCELRLSARIVQAITFDSAPPAFSVEMLMLVTLEERTKGARR